MADKVFGKCCSYMGRHITRWVKWISLIFLTVPGSERLMKWSWKVSFSFHSFVPVNNNSSKQTKQIFTLPCHSSSLTKLVWSQLGLALLGLTSHSSFLCHSLNFNNNTIINGKYYIESEAVPGCRKRPESRMCVFLYTAAETETIPQFLPLTIHLS